MDTIYFNNNGRRFILVAVTRSGVYAWFRPIEHAEDGFYDVNMKIADMRAM